MNLVDKIKSLWWHEGHLNESQRDFLIDLLTQHKPQFCIETGFATGRSSVTTLIAAQPKKLVSIDVNLDYMGARSHAESLIKEFTNFNVIENDSSQVLNESFFNDQFPEGIDYAFVDGSHTYSGAISDMRSIFKYLKSGAIMVVDDYRSGPPDGCSIPDVNRAVDDFSVESSTSIEPWYSNGKGFAIFRKN